MRELAELRVTTPVTAITGFEVATDLEPLEGKWYVSDSTVSDKFVRRFQERYGHTHVYGVGNYYDAVRLIVHLFERSPSGGKPTPEQLALGMRDLSNFSSIFGTLEIDADGIISYQPVFRKVAGGKRVTVELGDI